MIILYGIESKWKQEERGMPNPWFRWDDGGPDNLDFESEKEEEARSYKKMLEVEHSGYIFRLIKITREPING